MKKSIFKKLGALFLGLSMAAGVGVSIGTVHKNASSVYAGLNNTPVYSSGTPSFGSSYAGNVTKEMNDVSWTFSNVGNNTSMGWNKSSQNHNDPSAPLTTMSENTKIGGVQTSGGWKVGKIVVTVSNADSITGTWYVWYSTNSGSSWTLGTSASMTSGTTSFTYDHGSNIGDSVRFAFGYGTSKTTGTRVNLSNIQVYEYEEVQTHTVSFDANNAAYTGSTPSALQSTGGAAITLPAALSCTGYTWLGWNTSSSGGQSTRKTAGSSYTPSSSHTLYGEWQINSYTVNGSGITGGSLSSSDNINYGGDLDLSIVPSTNYTYPESITVTMGGNDISNSVLYDDSDGTIYYTPVTGNIIITAACVPEGTAYTVSYDANGGSVSPASEEIIENGNPSFPTPTRSGFNFKGWQIDGSGTLYTKSNEYTVTGDVNFVASWAAVYTVTFNANGGSSSPTSQSVESGSTFTFPSAGTKTHYSFSGWKSPSDSNLYAVGATSPAVSAAITYTAQWAPDAQYDVTYTAGENGSGSLTDEDQWSGSYTLKDFANLTGVTANSGYKFSHYSVGGVSKNPGDTIELTAATTIDVIFTKIPLKYTYDMTKINNFSSWTTGYNTHSGITFTPDPEYSATIDLFGASRQSSGVGSTYPCLAFKSETEVELIDFSLTEEGYKIENVEIVFVQRGTNKPTLSLHKGSGINSSAVATLAINGDASSEQKLSFDNLNDTVFTVGYSNGKTGSNVSVGLKSITVELSVQGSFGDLDHISISKNPKNIYTLGDLNDVTGINITAYDGADESTANIMSLGYDSEGVSFSIMNNSTLTNLGSNTNTVSYTNGSITKTTSYEIVVYDLASFNKISKEQTDWSGVYLIYSENYIFDSSLNNPDQDNNVVSVNIEDDAITCGQQFAVTIEKYSDGYSIKLLNGKYIGNSLSDNGLTVSDTALVNKISYNTTNNNVVITNAAGNTTFRLYSTTSTDRFRYYKNSSTGSEIQLFKLATSSALEEAENWARDNFIIECDATGETAPDVEMWGLIAESFDADLGDNAKIIFKEAIGNSSSEASIVEQTVAKYDYIVGKYGSATYADFMSRSPSNGARVNPIANLSNVDNSVWVISAVAVAGLTAIGGYFFYRKRKENF